mgnify:CR=1 FL=1
MKKEKYQEEIKNLISTDWRYGYVSPTTSLSIYNKTL